MSYLDNGVVRVGVDLNRGGAIVFFARKGQKNLVNNFDLGRQIQLSFFSGPVPFRAQGQSPAKHWEHLGWNPIQSGDDFGNRSRVLEHTSDEQTIYVKTQPLQWPLNNVPGECTYESWLQLDGHALKVRARLKNARSDKTQHPARLQELPAVYANAEFHRVISYTGDRPFTGGRTELIPRPPGEHPWGFWVGTEGWAALVNARDNGLGLITPGRVYFTGGFAGEPGRNDPLANSTGYLAGQAEEILDHDIVYEFQYEIVAGSLEEIRARAQTHKPTGLPSWRFAGDRQGWHLQNASDTGWPIRGHLHMQLSLADPQLISPYIFVRAEDAPVLMLEAAFRTRHRTATVYWQKHGQPGPTDDQQVTFPILGDGHTRIHRIHLSTAPEYTGAIIRLRLDPAPFGAPGDWAKIRTIRLVGPAGR